MFGFLDHLQRSSRHAVSAATIPTFAARHGCSGPVGVRTPPPPAAPRAFSLWAAACRRGAAARHPMRSVLLPILILAALAAVPRSAQTPAEPPAAGANLTRALGADAAGLVVVRSGSVLHRSLHGSFQDDQVLALGGASEWLAVATVL